MRDLAWVPRECTGGGVTRVHTYDLEGGARDACRAAGEAVPAWPLGKGWPGCRGAEVLKAEPSNDRHEGTQGALPALDHLASVTRLSTLAFPQALGPTQGCGNRSLPWGPPAPPRGHSHTPYGLGSHITSLPQAPPHSQVPTRLLPSILGLLNVHLPPGGRHAAGAPGTFAKDPAL